MKDPSRLGSEDLLDLLAEISHGINAYESCRHLLNRQARRTWKKELNLLVKKYNKTIGHSAFKMMG